jgi:SNF2 family DNA or RNA helicase
MSGTASGDKPWNLWSVLNWLWPSFYRSYWKFIDHYAVKEKVENADGAVYMQFVGVKNPEGLHKEMSPWFVRHLKREQCCPHHPEGVMHWLPEKQYDRIWVELNPTQKKFYDQMRRHMVAWVGENEDTPLVASIVVAQLMRLSQFTLGTPEIVGKKWVWKADPDNPGQKKKVEVDDVRIYAPSSKIDAVKELIKDHQEEGKKFVLFSASKQACHIASEELGRAGITSEILSGDTKDSERRTMVERFVRGDFQVFIAVIQAAAEGIDGLQHATDTAIFLDRHWSTIKNMQAEDRLHRGGQKNTVTIIDIMARGTLDFGRHQKLEAKWKWIKTILGDYNAQEKVLRGEL